MVQRRRRLAWVVAVLALVLALSGIVVAVNRAHREGGVALRSLASPHHLQQPQAEPDAQPQPEPQAQPPAPLPTPPVAAAPSASSPTAGSDALIDVAVATLWLEPAQARPIDEPSLTNPVDARRWVSAMTAADKTWLVGKLATQALFGERVTVLDTRGDWTKVVVVDQPSSLDRRGYPGWLPTVQLSGRPAGPDTGQSALVTSASATLSDATPARPGLELSYATKLPVVAVDGPTVTVATPGGGRGVVARSDVEIAGTRPGTPTGADLVASAQAFSGTPYLWAGTSALGFDCSGLMWAVYRTHGVVIPRDADDQAAAGSPVDRSALEPGDLLFYASGSEIDSIHHVAMYVGNGTMIQSPATGRAVETVSVDTPGLAEEFWGARRY